MNKKLFYGATAVSVVAVGGYLYYRHLRTKALEEGFRLFLEDDTDELDAPEEGVWNPRNNLGFPDQKITVLTPEQEKLLEDELGLKFKEDGSLDMSDYVKGERPKRKEVNEDA